MESRAEHRYRLTLDGKPGSDWTTLTSRAQERRVRQGIGRDSMDLEVSPLYLAELRAAGLQIVTKSRWLNTVVVMRKDGTEVDDWSQLAFVTKVEMLTTTQRASVPEPAMADLRKANAIDSDDCSAPLTQVNALVPLYEAGYRGQGMLVAVLDAGFQNVDRWSWLMERVVGACDLYLPLSGQDRTYTADMHGSCCLSIMASPQSHGVWGTAQEAQYYLVRTETDRSETQLEEDMWVAGAELADSLGADVISSSLGYTTFDDDLDSHSVEQFCQGATQISRGAQAAACKGILVCNAAGNEGNKAWLRLLFPADVEEVLTVGGVTPQGTAVNFTSRGFLTPYVKPDVSARANHCYTVSTSGSAVSTGAGTSYATPLIAGLCASLWSAVPSLTAEQLREAVRQSASRWSAPDSIVGYGIPDFGKALTLAREMTGEEQAIEPINADAPQGDTGISYYNLMGQPLEGKPCSGMIYLRRRSNRQNGKSFQQR